MKTLLFLLIISVPAQAQYFELKKPLLLLRQEAKFEFKGQIYFGKKYEVPSHIIIHFLIGMWRVDYSIVAAISIETAEAANGKFEIKDVAARLGGCLGAYLVKRIFL